ncbi:MAG: sigma-70 family RNA polymerase sigma factor [Pyrinomonadaceae bacterium]
MADLSPDNFKKFLDRLDPDPEQAAKKYLTLCESLVKLLAWRGCPTMDAENLADETVNRVSKQLEHEKEVKNFQNYCRGVAMKILLEYKRKRPIVNEFEERFQPSFSEPLPDVNDERMKCLEECLKELDPGDRQLVIDYYASQNEEKNKVLRKKLAAERGMTLGTLRVKAFRLRARLEKCIKKCLDAAG